MKILTTLVAVVIFSNLFASSLYTRYSNAVNRCLNQNSYPSGEIRPIPAEDLSHYTKSNVQAVLSPVFIGIFDHFGSVVQGMIAGGDEARVKPYMQSLARDAKRVAQRYNLNQRQQICIAGCITNQLMEANGDVNPFNSLDLAIASGEGFCRHFTGATKYLLDRMSVSNRSETALDHVYTVINYQSQKLIFDATVSDGKYDCFFYRAP